MIFSISSGLPDAQRLKPHKKEGAKLRENTDSPSLPSHPEPQTSGSFHSSYPFRLNQLSHISCSGGVSLSESQQPSQGYENLSDRDGLAWLQETVSVENFTEHQVKAGLLDCNVSERALAQDSAVEICRGKLRVHSIPASSTEIDRTTFVSTNSRIQKLAPPSLVLAVSSSSASLPSTSPLTSSPTSILVGAGRMRKLSVVTPPISPGSPESSSQNAGRISVSSLVPASTNIVQLTSMISINGSPQAGSSHSLSERMITPVETVSIHALPPIKATEGQAVGAGLRAGAGPGGTDLLDAGSSCGSGCGGSRGIVKIFEPPLISSGLPNGLESERAGSSLLIQSTTQNIQKELQKKKSVREEESSHINTIPDENRVTCAVEIHRQRSMTPVVGTRSAAGVQGGHKETML